MSHPVTGLHVVDDQAGDEIVEVTVIEDASDMDVSRVVDSLRAIPHRVVRRAIGFGVRYE